MWEIVLKLEGGLGGTGYEGDCCAHAIGVTTMLIFVGVILMRLKGVSAYPAVFTILDDSTHNRVCR